MSISPSSTNPGEGGGGDVRKGGEIADIGGYRPDEHEKTQLLLKFCVSTVTCGHYVHRSMSRTE